VHKAARGRSFQTLGLMNVITSSQAALCAQHVVAKAPKFAAVLAGKKVDTVEFVRSMTAQLCELIAATASTVEKEYTLEASQVAGAGRKRTGRLDIFARFHDGSSLAVELDRANKTWSLFKLSHMATQFGAEAVWIRWRGTIKFQSCKPVAFVDLTQHGNTLPARASARRSSRT
jgi:hypothetical protein